MTCPSHKTKNGAKPRMFATRRKAQDTHTKRQKKRQRNRKRKAKTKKGTSTAIRNSTIFVVIPLLIPRARHIKENPKPTLTLSTPSLRPGIASTLPQQQAREGKMKLTPRHRTTCTRKHTLHTCPGGATQHWGAGPQDVPHHFPQRVETRAP